MWGWGRSWIHGQEMQVSSQGAACGLLVHSGLWQQLPINCGLYVMMVIEIILPSRTLFPIFSPLGSAETLIWCSLGVTCRSVGRFLQAPRRYLASFCKTGFQCLFSLIQQRRKPVQKWWESSFLDTWVLENYLVVKVQTVEQQCLKIFFGAYLKRTIRKTHKEMPFMNG